MYLNLIFNLILLLVIGFLIGDERQRGGKIIGVRTTTMVLLGAFIFTTISVLVGDAPRMVTGVAGAVGFIGSGLIWKGDEGGIGNVTTAVLILVLAGIGCMLGLSLRWEALIMSIVTIIVLHFYKKINHNA